MAIVMTYYYIHVFILIFFSLDNLISTAFHSIKEEKHEKADVSSAELAAEIDAAIAEAKTLPEMLALAERQPIHRKQALRIVSILSEWTQSDRIKVSDFENDARFLNICRLLGKKVDQLKVAGPIRPDPASRGTFQTEDLSLVMSVAGDDEAAKLVGSISLPQMVTVLTALSQKKRRSTPLLRSLSYNISNSTGKLNLKLCADVLYSMATLNFTDAVLVARVSGDIQNELPKNEDRPAVVGSIITSLGLLRHRDTGMHIRDRLTSCNAHLKSTLISIFQI